MGPGRPGRERGSVGDEVQRASRVIAVPASIDMVTLLGPRDAFLRVLEDRLAADIHVRGSQVTVTGEPGDVASAVEILTELITIIRTGQGLSEETVERVINLAAEDLKPSEILTADIISARGRTVRPKTLNQKRYVDAIDRHTVVFGIGPAGTGKTYLAMAKAVQALQSKQVSRIILTRPAIEAGERLGFLPGTLNDKIDPYLRPLYDALHDMVEGVAVAVEARDLHSGAVEARQIGLRGGRVGDDLVDLGDVHRRQETTGVDLDAVQPEVGDHLDRILQWAVVQNRVVDTEFHRFTCFPLSAAYRATAARISMLWTPSSKDALRGRDSSSGISATSSRKARAW